LVGVRWQAVERKRSVARSLCAVRSGIFRASGKFMSGFAGMIRLSGGEAALAEDARRIEKMAHAIAFRGPDAQNTWSHPHVHFCFSFLKTGPAPQTPTQPCSLDGRTWLLGDVRLDGRDELLRRFEKRGEKLEPGISDEELVLHVFQIFGENGIAG